jgi:outer membrane receptor for ferrienterochelin and colicins
MLKYLSTLWVCMIMQFAWAQQSGSISGKVQIREEGLAGVTIQLERTSFTTQTDDNGSFELKNVPAGSYTLIARSLGYQTYRTQLQVSANQNSPIEITLLEDNLSLNEVVVSATRYGVDRKEAAVIVNVISPKVFTATQSVAMSETLNFQPGVRLETNCQNCGFSQVRLNGLEGGYSQILINSRAVFSALNSVYGLDQIPTSMVERIEVVRSGGSALFGSNAIAGTINVITKDPVENDWRIGNTTSLIDGKSWDQTVDFNSSIVSNDLKNGVTFYGMHRQREAYDANNDGFTEMTKLKALTFGSKAFYKITPSDKLTLDVSFLNEFRRGGEDTKKAPHLTDITEQLQHNSTIGGLTYDRVPDHGKSKFSAYLSGQVSTRGSYYGGLAAGTTPLDSAIAANAYGDTDDMAAVGGVQYSRYFNNDVLTIGGEHQLNSTQDEIAGYNRMVDQRNNSTGIYAQYEWKPISDLTLLLGARYDHVLVDGKYRLQNTSRESKVNTGAFSPRLTLLYNFTPELQFRGGFARGFRAPQAFNEDMHVSSAGGQQVFVLLSNDLKTEYSNAYTASLNYTRNIGATQVNALVEGFYTDLQNPFTNILSGELNGVLLNEMINGQGAYVKGSNIEISIAPSAQYSLQFGGTLQQSRYKEAQELFEGSDLQSPVFTEKFVRAPNAYGYLNSNWKIKEVWSLDLTGVYTGSMIAPRLTEENQVMLLNKTPQFFEINTRIGKTWNINHEFSIELSGGVQNIFNAFQKDFDRGPLRDSDYVYGPSRPRTFFVGLKIGHFH